MELILNSKKYEKDPDFGQDLLENAIAERNFQEQRKAE